MKWINFLHLYQPANADDYGIKEATERSYLKLVEILEKHPRVKFTLNVTACLLARGEFDRQGLPGRLKKLLGRGQIELTGSAAYHALLPLVPESEVRAQITETEEILKKYFGDDFKPKGFFLPEMAYSEKVAKIIKEFGYEWIILDEISAGAGLGRVDCRKIYTDQNSGLKVIFRSRKFSNSYVPDRLAEFFEESDPVVTATDAELYGLRHEDPTGQLEKILADENIRTEVISEFIKTAPDGGEIKIVPSNWESTEKELKKKMPFALWYDRNNRIQMRIWKLAGLADGLIEKYRSDDNYCWARWHLVRGLASCTFWWASGRDFSHNFGPRAWSPDEIERGVNELIRSIRSLHDASSRKYKIAAEKTYIKIKHLIWQKHWGHYWKNDQAETISR